MHLATYPPRLPAPDRAVPFVCIGRKRSIANRCGVSQRVPAPRTGVTLLELLVVLVLMAISAALVLPALSAKTVETRMPGDEDGAATPGGRQTYLPPDAAISAVLTSARRAAVQRGEPVHLRVAADGVWAIVPLRGGAAISDGRASLPLLWLPDVVVDALGTCVLSQSVVAPATASAWDALACRWRRVAP
ncbi:MAG: prepilin-type N-terminal cleavage/methylation domain-containing protein [Phycisphaerae bacterium]|nr:prepilin-type N-terminal cleavage/methylation domain-containing protein [Gemmatimonadaceae bacterium]